jgi:hypothetical protein
MGLWVIVPAYCTVKIVAKFVRAPVAQVTSRVVLRAVSVVVVIALGTGTSHARDTPVPWEVVTAVVGPRGGGLPVSDANDSPALAHPMRTVSPEQNYALKPRQTAFFQTPDATRIAATGGKLRVELSQWRDSSWKSARPVAVRMRDGRIQLVRGISDTGLFRICLSPSAPADRPWNVSFYAIVSENWKKDLVLFCQHHRQQTELNADPEMIRSSLVVSHWDHVMGLASGSQALTGRILNALARALESQQAFESGRCPDLVRGLNKLRLKRFQGAVIEEFVVFLPDHKAGSQAQPLVVHCDRRRFAPRDRYRERTGYIDLWWHTVTDKEVDWKSYQALREVMSHSVRVDPDRVYVAGDCGNALAAMSLALNYPDQWAECCVSLGNTYRHLTGNAWNLPFILCKGGHNEAGYDAYFDFALKCFEYHGCPHFRGSGRHDARQLRGAPVPQAIRERSPQRVFYTIESMRNPAAYWVTIRGREDENHPGSLDARAEGQTIHVTTDNLDAYELDLVVAPVDSNQPVQIVENGRPPELVRGPTFVRRPEKYRDAARVKTSQLPGSLEDAFTDAYVVVWGNTGRGGALAAAGKQAAQSLAGEGPCLADTDLPAPLVGTHNLVLVGTAESNRWLAKVEPSLPVRIVEGQIIADRMRYRGPDLAYVLIYPNPLNAARYVVVCSATSARAMAALPGAYSQMKTVRPADVGVFEIAEDGKIRWHILERLDATWNWHEDYCRPVMAVRGTYPSWQWQRWLASVLRRRLDLDAVIYEEPFLFENVRPEGLVTRRDLFNSFKNYWFIQVDLSGADLRKLATASLSHPAGRSRAVPIVHGVSLMGGPDMTGGNVLAVSALQDGRMYRVAMSEPCIKGEPLGMVPQNYEITGLAYLVPTLAAFLETNRNLDVDAELDRLRLQVF